MFVSWKEADTNASSAQIILTASPGPGKGCLISNSSGSPSCLPKSLTSSLWYSHKGSITLPDALHVRRVIIWITLIRERG